MVTAVNRSPALSTVDQDLIAIDLAPSGVQFEAGSTPVVSFSYSGQLGYAPNVTGLHRSAPFAVCQAQDGSFTGSGLNCTLSNLVATQLERTGARALFPSYDMPWVKAKFETTVSAPTAAAPVVLSNMDVRSKTNSRDGKQRTYVFQTTPLMSTYLFAVVAGHLNQVQNHVAPQDSTFTVRGWAAPGREQLMAEATRIGHEALDYYNGMFTSVEQPITLYDFVAIPGKLYAMENWGLLMFDESRALHNASTASTYDHVRTASVMCHEVAHQWLGNLATCEDWTQLAMNEGLASEEEYSCMQTVVPSIPGDVLRYRMVSPASVDVPAPHDGPLSNALVFAGDPVQLSMSPASDLDLAQFGLERVVYSKGATFFFLLRYASQYLIAPLGDFWGPGLNTLLQKHQYSTFVFSDALQAVVDNLLPVYQANVGVGKHYAAFNWAAGLINRTMALRTANGNIPLERQLGSNGSAPIGSWMYSPAYPFMNTTLPNLIVPNNYTATIANIGSNQTRYCNWNLTQSEMETLGFAADDVTRVMTACQSPVKFVTTITLHNLTDCPANKTGGIGTFDGATDGGAVGYDEWVLNAHSVRLWRTQYSEVHFNNLMNEARAATACPDSIDTTNVSVGANGLCCSGAAEQLETAGIMNDALWFSQDGKYPADWALRFAEATAASPVAGSNLGQYLLLLPAMEAAEALKLYIVGNDTECMQHMQRFEAALFTPHTDAILAAVQQDPQMNSPLNETNRDMTLQRMAASPILRIAALNVGGTASPLTASDSGGGGSVGAGRKMLANDGIAPDGNTTATTEASPPIVAAPAGFGPADTVGDGGGDAPPTEAPSPLETVPNEAAGPTSDTPQTSTPQTNTTTPSSIDPKAVSEDLQRSLCTLLPSTPLWTTYVYNMLGATEVPPLPGTSANSTATQNVPADLLPAVYAVAAAAPDTCRAVLEQPYIRVQQAGTIDSGSTASVKDGVRKALMKCFLEEPSMSEALRCMYALTYTLDYSLMWNVPPFPLNADFEEFARYSLRKAYLEQYTRPSIVAFMARGSHASWLNIVDALANGDLWDMFGANNACLTMVFIPYPSNQQQIDAWEGLMAGRGGSCESGVRARGLGRLGNARNVAVRAGQEVCAFLSEWATAHP